MIPGLPYSGALVLEGKFPRPRSTAPRGPPQPTSGLSTSGLGGGGGGAERGHKVVTASGMAPGVGAFSSWDSWKALVLTVYRIGEKGVMLPRARNLMSRLHFPLRSNFIRSPNLLLIISPHFPFCVSVDMIAFI